jgi:stress-induced morphogen
MGRQTKKFARENAYFINPKTKRINYAEICKKCAHECKQSFRAQVICSRFEKKSLIEVS